MCCLVEVSDQREVPGTLRWCAIIGILIFIIVVIIILVAFHQVDVDTDLYWNGPTKGVPISSLQSNLSLKAGSIIYQLQSW